MLAELRTFTELNVELRGMTLDKVKGTKRRLMDLTDVTEESLWDDVDNVAWEEYRDSLYYRIGYLRAYERVSGPETRSGKAHVTPFLKYLLNKLEPVHILFIFVFCSLLDTPRADLNKVVNCRK